MNSKNHILIVEDTLSLALLYQRQLKAEGYNVTVADNGYDALTTIRQNIPDLILLDLGLPDMDGADILEAMQNIDSAPPVIVITADSSLPSAVNAMRLGALDYIVKPFSESRLVVTVRNALEREQLKANLRAIEEVLPKEGFQGFIGASTAMQAVYATIQNVAHSSASVFITGESGTGKEVAAQAIHDVSKGTSAPFVAINCGAIPHDLIESEIFGHKKGAFTGAIADRLGAARAAHGGTLFLDEICEMRLDLQTKLLRFLQTRTVQPVGSEKAEVVDLRVICATNRDPFEEVLAGRFREDLYYRLNVIPLELPPLRTRGRDVLDLADYFLKIYGKEEKKKFKGLSSDAKHRLMSRRWPGNVRELQNVIRQVSVMAASGEIAASAIPPDKTTHQPDSTPAPQPVPTGDTTAAKIAADYAADTHPSGSVDGGMDSALAALINDGSLAEIERHIIEERITRYADSLPQAAKSLGLSPSTLYRKRDTWDKP